MFRAQRGRGSWLNGLSLGTQAPVHLPLARTIAVVDFKRLDRALAAKLGARRLWLAAQFGSSALDWCWLADGRFHVYLHGGQKLWDYAAGILILTEAGGQAVTLDDEEVFTSDWIPVRWWRRAIRNCSKSGRRGSRPTAKPVVIWQDARSRASLIPP